MLRITPDLLPAHAFLVAQPDEEVFERRVALEMIRIDQGPLELPLHVAGDGLAGQRPPRSRLPGLPACRTKRVDSVL